MRVAVVFAMLSALAASCGGAAADETCGPLKMLTTVALIPGDDGRVAIPVTLAGQTHLMLLDTGAYATSLTPRVVDALKLARSRSRIAIRDVLGNTSNVVASVPDLALGRLHADHATVFVLPDADESQYQAHSTSDAGLPTRLSGIFGSDFLRPYDLDLDFGNNKMHLASQDHCEGKVIYWRPDVFSIVPFALSPSGGVVATMTLDGKEMRVLIDTGASQSSMRADTARKMFGIAGPAPGESMDNATLNDESVTGMFAHRFAMLTTDGLAINNPLILIYPDVADTRTTVSQSWYDRTMGERPADMILGMNILKRLHVYIAYGERKMYLSPATASAPPATGN